MREEFIEYATHTRVYSEYANNNKSLFFGSRVMKICSSIILAAFYFMMIMISPYVGIAMIVLWALMLIVRSKEKNAYMRSILIDGMATVYFATFFAVASISMRENAGTYALHTVLIFAAFLLLYEIAIAIRIRTKKYSRLSAKPNKLKKEDVGKIAIGSSLGAVVYRILHIKGISLFPKSTNALMGTILIYFMLLCGCAMLQKYLILKILKYQ